MDLEGSVALVTGGAVRLGAAISRALAAAGARVAIHHHSSGEAAAQLVEEIEESGGEALPIRADLSAPEEPRDLVRRLDELIGPAHVLVNNAALFHSGGLAAADLESWSAQMAVNLRAPLFLSQAFVARLPADRRGVIVNVGDARAQRPGVDHLVYRLTKVGLVHLTECLALELAPRIRVNAVNPGPMLPPPGESEAGFRRRVADRVPLGQPGGAAPVADAVAYLIREEFATGTVLRVDGGEWL